MNVTVVLASIAAAYLLIINLSGFTVCGIDKRRAVKGAWRIPERQLMMIAAVGGSIGILSGMFVFRHKTRHKKFVLGVPAILMCQVAVVFAVVYWGFIK